MSGKARKTKSRGSSTATATAAVTTSSDVVVPWSAPRPTTLQSNIDVGLGLASAAFGQTPEQQAAALVEEEKRKLQHAGPAGPAGPAGTTSSASAGSASSGASSWSSGLPELDQQQEMKRAALSYGARNRQIADDYVARKMGWNAAGAGAANSTGSTNNASFVSDPTKLLEDVASSSDHQASSHVAQIEVRQVVDGGDGASVATVATIAHPQLSQYLDPLQQTEQWVLFNVAHQLQRPVKEEAMLRLMGVFENEQHHAFLQAVGTHCGNHNYWRAPCRSWIVLCKSMARQTHPTYQKEKVERLKQLHLQECAQRKADFSHNVQHHLQGKQGLSVDARQHAKTAADTKTSSGKKRGRKARTTTRAQALEAHAQRTSNASASASASASAWVLPETKTTATTATTATAPVTEADVPAAPRLQESERLHRKFLQRAIKRGLQLDAAGPVSSSFRFPHCAWYVILWMADITPEALNDQDAAEPAVFVLGSFDTAERAEQFTHEVGRDVVMHFDMFVCAGYEWGTRHNLNLDHIREKYRNDQLDLLMKEKRTQKEKLDQHEKRTAALQMTKATPIQVAPPAAATSTAATAPAAIDALSNFSSLSASSASAAAASQQQHATLTDWNAQLSQMTFVPAAAPNVMQVTTMVQDTRSSAPRPLRPDEERPDVLQMNSRHALAQQLGAPEAHVVHAANAYDA